jgi:hypothetical protein
MRLRLALVALSLVLLLAAYFALAWQWSYSDGERAGWVQKFSRKGWVCKTWEGELSMAVPGSLAVERFKFTVHDSATAEQINKLMGRRVALHYEQKVGLPGSCFGETRYFVTQVVLTDEVPLAPNIGVPNLPAVPAASAASR